MKSGIDKKLVKSAIKHLNVTGKQGTIHAIGVGGGWKISIIAEGLNQMVGWYMREHSAVDNMRKVALEHNLIMGGTAYRG